MIDFEKLILEPAKDFEWHDLEPEQTPLTIRDIHMAEGCYDMCLPLADPCPNCGAFNMRVGDYVCTGYCHVCTDPKDYS